MTFRRRFRIWQFKSPSAQLGFIKNLRFCYLQTWPLSGRICSRMFTLNFTSTVWRTTPYSFRCLLHLRNGVFIINKTSLCILCDYDLSTWHTVGRFWFICIMFCEHAYCDMTLMCTCCDCLLLCLAHWPAAGNSVSRGGWSWHTSAVLRWDPALPTDVNWSKFCGNDSSYFFMSDSIHVHCK